MSYCFIGWGTIIHEAEDISRSLQNPTHSCFKPTTMSCLYTHLPVLRDLLSSRCGVPAKLAKLAKLEKLFHSVNISKDSEADSTQ